MAAAIWSAPADKMLDFPAENFLAFFSNHHLLQYNRPVWRIVKGGSRRYVESWRPPCWTIYASTAPWSRSSAHRMV
jgi:predicted NAD/FAD-binding protein